MTAALRTEQLGKRYGRVWGLRECTLEVPAGSVVGLVGPNGAGKSTLLQLIVGLLRPTEGHVDVFGATGRVSGETPLAQVAYVAQEHPLYRDFTVADMLRFGCAMNPRWDQTLAVRRMAALGIPLDRKIKRLSGGQQAQVSLAMALAKRAPLLILDEPVASLDPVARLRFMQEVMAAVAEVGLTVVIASHVVTELERICDWLIVIAGGRVRVSGSVDDLVSGHWRLIGPRARPGLELPGLPIYRTDSDRHSTVLVRTGSDQPVAHPAWRCAPAGFEEIVLAYLRHPANDVMPARGSATTGETQ